MMSYSISMYFRLNPNIDQTNSFREASLICLLKVCPSKSLFYRVIPVKLHSKSEYAGPSCSEALMLKLFCFCGGD